MSSCSEFFPSQPGPGWWKTPGSSSCQDSCRSWGRCREERKRGYPCLATLLEGTSWFACWWGKLCFTSNVSFPKRNFPRYLRTPTVREVNSSTSSVVYSLVFEVFTEMGSWGEKLGWHLIASMGIPESEDQFENWNTYHWQCLLAGNIDLSTHWHMKGSSNCHVTFLWKTTLHDHLGKCNTSVTNHFHVWSSLPDVGCLQIQLDVFSKSEAVHWPCKSRTWSKCLWHSFCRVWEIGRWSNNRLFCCFIVKNGKHFKHLLCFTLLR